MRGSHGNSGCDLEGGGVDLESASQLVPRWSACCFSADRTVGRDPGKWAGISPQREGSFTLSPTSDGRWSLGRLLSFNFRFCTKWPWGSFYALQFAKIHWECKHNALDKTLKTSPFSTSFETQYIIALKSKFTQKACRNPFSLMTLFQSEYPWYIFVFTAN